MNSASANDKKRLGLQVGLILLASAAVGLAYNALNPAGLSWRDPAPAEPAEPERAQASAGLYRVETISAHLVGSTQSNKPTAPARPAARPTISAPRRAPGASPIAAASQTTWEKVRPLVERGEVVLVDSRSRLSYEAGHIPGAVNLPEKEVESVIGEFLATHLPPDARLVIYCANVKCASSAKLAARLTNKYGYDQVQYVPGGYLEWLQNKK